MWGTGGGKGSAVSPQQCPQAVFLQCSDMPVPLAAHHVILDEVLIAFVDCIIGQVHADITLAGNHKRYLFTLNH